MHIGDCLIDFLQVATQLGTHAFDFLAEFGLHVTDPGFHVSEPGFHVTEPGVNFIEPGVYVDKLFVHLSLHLI